MRADTQYAYAVGRIRTLERKLIDKNRIERMVEAGSLEEAAKVLAEADYGYLEDMGSKDYDFEELLKDEEKKVYGLLRELAPRPEIFDMFLLGRDYHNLKVLLKSEFGESGDSRPLKEGGAIPVNTLEVLVRERKFNSMPGVMARALKDAIDAFNRTGDPQAVDMVLDAGYLKHVREAAGESGEPFLAELAAVSADLTNIKAFVRVKRLGREWAFFERVTAPGGKVRKDIYSECFDASLEAFVERMRFTPYGRLCEEGIGSFIRTGSLAMLEKLADEYLLSFVQKVRYRAFGVEPLVSYLIIKENEIRNVRIVIVGKQNGIPGEVIRERLRDIHV